MIGRTDRLVGKQGTTTGAHTCHITMSGSRPSIPPIQSVKRTWSRTFRWANRRLHSERWRRSPDVCVLTTDRNLLEDDLETAPTHSPTDSSGWASDSRAIIHRYHITRPYFSAIVFDQTLSLIKIAYRSSSYMMQSASQSQSLIRW